jgi:hypothetical protein
MTGVDQDVSPSVGELWFVTDHFLFHDWCGSACKSISW